MTGTTQTLTVGLTGEDAIQNALEALVSEVADLTPVMDKIGGYLVASVQRRFEISMGPEQSSWRPSIRARSEEGQTLKQSGALATFWSHRAKADGVEVGTSVPYAAIHQFGGTIRAKKAKALHFMIGGEHVIRKSVTIPARPFLGINAEDEDAILDIFRDHLKGLTA